MARVALVQLPAFGIEDAAASLAHTMARIDAAARERPDIIVLPEVTYPAYFLGAPGTRPATLPPGEVMARFAAKAREHGAYIAAGMALDAPGGGYANGAALFGRDGALVGRYDKSFLFYFDRRWFARGAAYPVFETDVGRVGMLICADGRLPEIARSLAVGGAEIILDLTAWVSGARYASDLNTTQREYLMPARAIENGVWIACANKYGIEAESIVYCGRSCVIDPGGRIVAELGVEDDAALVYDVPVAPAAPPVTRRPELYSALTAPTASLPVLATLGESLVAQDEQRRLAVVQMPPPADGRAFVGTARRHAERLALHDIALLLFPAMPGRLRASYPHDEVVAGMLAVARDTAMLLAFTVNEGAAGQGRRVAYVAGADGVIARHAQTHRMPSRRFETLPLGDEPCAVIDTPAGRIGLMFAAEALAPEVARSLMLRGAEILLIAADHPPFPLATIARARAEENRVFVATASAPSANGAAMIIDPGGRVLAQALAQTVLSVSATVNRAASHLKADVPGTDVVRDRQPESYGALTREGSRAGTVV